MPSTCFPATKTSGITSGKSGGCRSMSIRSTASWKTRRIARGSPRIFEQGLSKVVGYALPLRREYYTDGTSAWESGAWFFRPEQMYLVPGDSPMGFRLPLDSIPWVSESEYPRMYEQDPMAPRSPLPDRAAMSKQRYVAGMPEPGNPQGYRRADARIRCLRTRIPRRGNASVRFAAGSRANRRRGSFAPRCARKCAAAVLRVFMPPQHYLEDYLELVAAIEDTAAESRTSGSRSRATRRRTIRA